MRKLLAAAAATLVAGAAGGGAWAAPCAHTCTTPQVNIVYFGATAPNQAVNIAMTNLYGDPVNTCSSVIKVYQCAQDLDNNGTFETPGQTVTFSAAGLTAPLSVTISVRGTDPGGMTDIKTATVNVVWHNGGFNLPGGGNRVTFKAGANVPVKFSLGGDHGLDILRPGYPASDAFTCGGTAPTNATGQINWGGTLKYDAPSDTYSFNWKTDKAWANSCRVLVVGLKDGTNLVATFTFN